MRSLVSQEEESENNETLWNGNISMSFDITYNDVPLQSNEPEVNAEKETSKEPSAPASPAKTGKSVNHRKRNMINMPFVQSLKHYS